MLNKSELKKIFVTENNLVQKSDPIYKYPLNNWGRAHFYSPVKKVAGSYIDTYWFNIIIIWLTSIMWYFVLYFDLIRKGLDYFSKISFKRSGKKEKK